MSQAEMDSTRKTALESVEKSLVVTIIELLQQLPCLVWVESREWKKNFWRVAIKMGESSQDV